MRLSGAAKRSARSKARREKRLQREKEKREEHRKLWPISDAEIGQLAKGGTPLNDHFASGGAIYPERLLQHVAALERRIDELEGKELI